MFQTIKNLKRMFLMKAGEMVRAVKNTKRMRVSYASVMEYNKYNTNDDGSLDATEAKALMLDLGFPAEVVDDDRQFGRYFRPFATEAESLNDDDEGDTEAEIGIRMEQYPAFRKLLGIDLVLFGMDKDIESTLTMQDTTKALKRLNHDVTKANLLELEVRYFSKPDSSISVVRFKQVEESFSTLGDSIESVVVEDDEDMSNGQPRMIVPRQETNVFSRLRVAKYVEVDDKQGPGDDADDELDDDDDDEPLVKIDSFEHQWVEVKDRNVLFKSRLGDADEDAAQTLSLVGCKVSNPGSMTQKMQLAQAGHKNIFCLELRVESGDNSDQGKANKVTHEKFLISASSADTMKAWQECVLANTRLKVDAETSGKDEKLLRMANQGLKLGAGLMKVGAAMATGNIGGAVGAVASVAQASGIEGATKVGSKLAELTDAVHSIEEGNVHVAGILESMAKLAPELETTSALGKVANLAKGGTGSMMALVERALKPLLTKYGLTIDEVRPTLQTMNSADDILAVIEDPGNSKFPHAENISVDLPNAYNLHHRLRPSL